MDIKRRKTKDVEISKEVQTNDYQTNSIRGNHVRDLVKSNLERMIEETETNYNQDQTSD